MPLPVTGKNGLLGNPKDPKPTQASASMLQRAIHKSTFLYGPAPPTTGTKLTPEQVHDFLEMLSKPVSTPMLTTNIAKMKAPLTRHSKSLASESLCAVHTWFELRWVDELTEIIGAEIGPHLNHLRNAPNWLTSTETKEIIGMLDPYAHIFPAPDPDGSRMANPYECKYPKCSVCSITTCKACKLSLFFQNAEAVKVLNVCAKGRKRGGRPWPISCSWLDPLPPRPGWAHKWKKEGLHILSDRIIARRWRKSGREERMTEGMKSIQKEVIADRDSAAKVLDQATRQSVKSALVDSDSVYNDVTGRKWTCHEDQMQSSATLNLLKKLGLDDDDGEAVEATGPNPGAKSHEKRHCSSVHGSIHHVNEYDDDDEEEIKPRERTHNSRAASIHQHDGDRSRLDSPRASCSSRDSVKTPHSPKAPSHRNDDRDSVRTSVSKMAPSRRSDDRDSVRTSDSRTAPSHRNGDRHFVNTSDSRMAPSRRSNDRDTVRTADSRTASSHRNDDNRSRPDSQIAPIPGPSSPQPRRSSRAQHSHAADYTEEVPIGMSRGVSVITSDSRTAPSHRNDDSRSRPISQAAPNSYRDPVKPSDSRVSSSHSNRDHRSRIDSQTASKRSTDSFRSSDSHKYSTHRDSNGGGRTDSQTRHSIKTSDSQISSSHHHHDDRSRPDSHTPSRSSRDSVDSWEASTPRSSRGSRATSVSNAGSAGHRSPRMEESKGSRYGAHALRQWTVPEVPERSSARLSTRR